MNIFHILQSFQDPNWRFPKKNGKIEVEKRVNARRGGRVEIDIKEQVEYVLDNLNEKGINGYQFIYLAFSYRINLCVTQFRPWQTTLMWKGIYGNLYQGRKNTLQK